MKRQPRGSRRRCSRASRPAGAACRRGPGRGQARGAPRTSSSRGGATSSRRRRAPARDRRAGRRQSSPARTALRRRPAAPARSWTGQTRLGSSVDGGPAHGRERGRGAFAHAATVPRRLPESTGLQVDVEPRLHGGEARVRRSRSTSESSKCLGRRRQRPCSTRAGSRTSSGVTREASTGSTPRSSRRLSRRPRPTRRRRRRRRRTRVRRTGQPPTGQAVGVDGQRRADAGSCCEGCRPVPTASSARIGGAYRRGRRRQRVPTPREVPGPRSSTTACWPRTTPTAVAACALRGRAGARAGEISVLELARALGVTRASLHRRSLSPAPARGHAATTPRHVAAGSEAHARRIAPRARSRPRLACSRRQWPTRNAPGAGTARGGPLDRASATPRDRPRRACSTAWRWRRSSSATARRLDAAAPDRDDAQRRAGPRDERVQHRAPAAARCRAARAAAGFAASSRRPTPVGPPRRRTGVHAARQRGARLAAGARPRPTPASCHAHVTLAARTHRPRRCVRAQRLRAVHGLRAAAHVRPAPRRARALRAVARRAALSIALLGARARRRRAPAGLALDGDTDAPVHARRCAVAAQPRAGGHLSWPPTTSPRIAGWRAAYVGARSSRERLDAGRERVDARPARGGRSTGPCSATAPASSIGACDDPGRPAPAAPAAQVARARPRRPSSHARGVGEQHAGIGRVDGGAGGADRAELVLRRRRHARAHGSRAWTPRGRPPRRDRWDVADALGLDRPRRRRRRPAAAPRQVLGMRERRACTQPRRSARPGSRRRAHVERTARVTACGAVRLIFSGIQPTGRKHLGNYIGAITPVRRRPGPRRPAIYCIVDLHAITVPYEPGGAARARLRHDGDPAGRRPGSERCILFRQCDVQEHTELCWLLSSVTALRRAQPDAPVPGQVGRPARARLAPGCSSTRCCRPPTCSPTAPTRCRWARTSASTSS